MYLFEDTDESGTDEVDEKDEDHCSHMKKAAVIGGIILFVLVACVGIGIAVVMGGGGNDSACEGLTKHCKIGCAALKPVRRLVETMPNVVFDPKDEDCIHKTPVAKGLSSPASEFYTPYSIPSSYASPLGVDDQIEKTVADAEITKALVMEYVKKITSLPNALSPSRETPDTNAMASAREYLQNTLQSMGIQTCLQDFEGEGRDKKTYIGSNVIGYIPGSSEGAVVIGAHYDDISSGQTAPGANDNGSGCAVLLSVAKAFTDARVQQKISKTVYFVAFAVEEQGLIGSTFFAADLKAGGANLPAQCKPTTDFSSDANHSVIALDMVGFQSSKFSVPVMDMETCPWATSAVGDNLASANNDINGGSMQVGYIDNPIGSDHIPFLELGIPAVLMVAADLKAYDPYYHKDTDTVQRLSGDQITYAAKMAFGGLFRMAVA